MLSNKYSDTSKQTDNIENDKIFKSAFSSRVYLFDRCVLFMVITGYSKLFLRNKIIPTDVINLCCNFHELEFESIKDFMNDKEYDDIDIQFNDSKEHIFEDLIFYHGTLIVALQKTLKLSVAKNFILGTDSVIDSYWESGDATIILNVGKNVEIGRFSQIKYPNDGNIYIKCSDMKIKQYGCIEMDDDDSEKKIECNIHINVKNTLLMERASFIQGGSVRIQCGSLRMHSNSHINALNDDLEINAKEIHVTKPLYLTKPAFYAKGKMQIHAVSFHEYKDSL